MITCEDLCYTGMKVKVENAEHLLYGSLLNDYNELGYLIVKEIFDNDNVCLTFDGAMINLSKSVLIPIVEESILKVVEDKKKQIAKLQKEVNDIEKFANKIVSQIMNK